MTGIAGYKERWKNELEIMSVNCFFPRKPLSRTVNNNRDSSYDNK